MNQEAENGVTNEDQATNEQTEQVTVTESDQIVSEATVATLDNDAVDAKTLIETMFTGLNVSKPPISSKPTAQYVPAFKMNHKRRGVCVIFNQVSFSKDLELGERTGSDVDAESLKECFQRLKFEVQLHKNMSCSSIKGLLANIGRQNHTDEDCFVCCFLSHGEEGEIIYAYDGILKVPDLQAPFKGDVCPSLAGKPKLFFIQACRGSKLDHGTDVTDSKSEKKLDDGMRIPTEADFLVAYSGVAGYYCWRNAARGSWFIQSLCEMINKFSQKLDLLSTMTLVNAKVAYDYESQLNDPIMRNKKQVSCIVSMLTKQVWFCPQEEIIVPLV